MSLVLSGHSVQIGFGYEQNLIHMQMKLILKPKKPQGLWREKYIGMVSKRLIPWSDIGQWPS